MAPAKPLTDVVHEPLSCPGGAQKTTFSQRAVLCWRRGRGIAGRRAVFLVDAQNDGQLMGLGRRRHVAQMRQHRRFRRLACLHCDLGDEFGHHRPPFGRVVRTC